MMKALVLTVIVGFSVVIIAASPALAVLFSAAYGLLKNM